MRQSPHHQKIIAEGDQKSTADPAAHFRRNAPGSSLPETLSLAEVADVLGISAFVFSRKRRKMEDEAGFPRALPGLRRYSTHAVLQWIRTNGGKPSQTLHYAAPSLFIGRSA